MTKVKYIAIVDDHDMVRKGLCALINLFPNYTILFDASTGKDFIQKLDPAQLPDIVLLDIRLPEMDGYEIAAWIHTHYPGIRILALSTMEDEASIIKMILQGADGYLLKDADTTELKQAFDEVLSTGFYYNDLIARKITGTSVRPANPETGNSGFLHFSDQEMKFIKLAVSEKTYQQIAKDMQVSETVVTTYLDAVLSKLNMSTRIGLVIFAIKNKVVSN